MNWFENKKLLVPWDYSDLSLNALRAAREMADSPNLVHVVHVASSISANEPGVIWGTVDEASRVQNLREHFDERAGDLADGVTFDVVFGRPGHMIVEKCEEIGADCIIISTHGRGGLEHMLLGSVAERVVRLSTCPVLMLPDHKR